jgi:HAD superfamily hydrolase (TIGR01509 family)
MPGPLAAAIFDFGDTLFHSPSGPDVLVEAGIERARAERLWEEIWLAAKTPVELARGRDLSLERHRSAWLGLFRRTEEEVPGMAELLYDRVMLHDDWLPYPDTAPVLSALHASGVRIGVVSNIPGPLRPAFERHGLAGWVDAFVESFRYGREKPDAGLFEAACRELGVRPADALLVGDNHLTDGAAVLAGLPVLLLPAVAPGSERGLRRVLDLFSAGGLG